MAKCNTLQNLNLTFSNQKLRISVGRFAWVHKFVSLTYVCVCGKKVEGSVLLGLSSVSSAGRFSRHALNHLFNQILVSVRVPSVLEPTHLYRTDTKRPDGMTLVPRKQGKQNLLDVTMVDALTPSRLSARSPGNSRFAAAEAEERKNGK